MSARQTERRLAYRSVGEIKRRDDRGLVLTGIFPAGEQTAIAAQPVQESFHRQGGVCRSRNGQCRRLRLGRHRRSGQRRAGYDTKTAEELASRCVRHVFTR